MRKIEFNDEQKQVISNSSDFLIVSAGPGAGKTETLSNYLIEQTKTIPENKINLVSSFTKIGTNEIKNRVMKKGRDIEKTKFKTFDSFLMNDLWSLYINRICLYIIKEYKFKMSNHFYEIKKINYSLNINGKKYNYQDLFRSLTKKNSQDKLPIFEWWINELEKGIFYSNPISDYILFEFMQKNDDIKKYIRFKINRIIIDEAQDLNELRIHIILFLHKDLNLKITLVGDQNQSIYQFAGSIDKAFDRIERQIIKYNGKFTHLKLTKNYRMDENSFLKNIIGAIDDYENSIKDFEKSINKANCIQNKNEFCARIKNFLENENNENMLILCEKNDEIIKIKNILNHDKNINFSLKIDSKFSNEMTWDQIEFVENLATYFLIKKERNLKNKVKINPTEIIMDYLFWNEKEMQTPFINLFSEKSEDQIIDAIIKKIGVDIKGLYNVYQNDYNFLNTFKPKKISVMTIHGAKGLEANHVLVFKTLIDKFINTKKKELIFVAISRAKKSLEILNNSILD